MQRAAALASRIEAQLQARVEELQTAVALLERANGALGGTVKQAEERSLELGARAAKAEAQVAVLTRQLDTATEREEGLRGAAQAEIAALKGAVQAVRVDLTLARCAWG